MDLYKIVNCKECGREVEQIDLFFGDRCIECYKKTPESKQDYSSDLFIKSIN